MGMDEKSMRRASAILSAVLFAAMVTVNGLANGLPLNGVNTGQLSDELPNLFVPAGLTFAIWGLIYALLLGYVVAALREAFGKGGDAMWSPADGWLFSLNAALNAAWIFAWHWRLVPLSLVIMLGILATLIVLVERMHRAGPPSSAVGPVRRFFLRTPIRVYLGWICVATIANVTAVLVRFGWNGGGLDPKWWTVAVILVGAGIGAALVARRGAVSSGLVVLWAYAGIIFKRAQVGGDAAWPVIAASIVGGLAVAGAIAVRLRRTNGRSRTARRPPAE
jgi:hypothetical protein